MIAMTAQIKKANAANTGTKIITLQVIINENRTYALKGLP
jgi:hypothetical protein